MNGFSVMVKNLSCIPGVGFGLGEILHMLILLLSLVRNKCVYMRWRTRTVRVEVTVPFSVA
jgi:hypothetical protein